MVSTLLVISQFSKLAHIGQPNLAVAWAATHTRNASQTISSAREVPFNTYLTRVRTSPVYDCFSWITLTHEILAGIEHTCLCDFCLETKRYGKKCLKKGKAKSSNSALKEKQKTTTKTTTATTKVQNWAEIWDKWSFHSYVKDSFYELSRKNNIAAWKPLQVNLLPHD